MNKIFSLLILFVFAIQGFAFTVVIDAGHGGKDPGAIGSFSKEKDLVLKHAILVGNMLKKNHKDIKVVYTRSKDVFIELNKRAKIANAAKADLFVSIHVNSAKNKSAKGMEVFTLGASSSKENMDVAMLENSVILLEDDYEENYEGFNPNDPDYFIMFDLYENSFADLSIECADLVQTNLIESTKRTDRSVRQARFFVLRFTKMPSILIELGFISNKEEELFLNDSKNQAKIAKAIYDGIIRYKTGLEKTTTHVDTENNANDAIKENNKNTAKTDSIKPKAEPITIVQKVDTTKYTFHLQILVSKNQYNNNDPIFKGYKPDKIVKEGNFYKYSIGNTNDYQEIVQIKNSIKTDFPDAFLIAYKNGKKVPATKAIKELNKNTK